MELYLQVMKLMKRAAWSRAAASCTRERACSHEKAKPRQRRQGHVRDGLLRLDLGLARGRLGHERRLPAHKSARALMIMRAKTKQEGGTYAAVSCCSGVSLACLVTSGGSLHKSACALMRKQAKRREEEGTHVAVSCCSVLVCWHRLCIASYSADATDKNKNVSSEKNDNISLRGALRPPNPPLSE